jgi:hypothetical protein
MWLAIVQAALAVSLPVQGVLVDGGGAPMDGTSVVTFKIWGGDADDPDLLWTGSVAVAFAGGAFATDLGLAATDPAAALASGDALWLSVTHGGGESERTPVGFVPRSLYALNASDASALGGSDPSSWLHEDDVGAGLELDGGQVSASATFIEDIVANLGLADDLASLSDDLDALASAAGATSSSVASLSAAQGATATSLSALTTEVAGLRAVPVGTIVPWFRPSAAVPVPSGWAPCDGRVIAAGAHGFRDGSGVAINAAITVPDLRNRVVVGASVDATAGSAGAANNLPTGAPGIGGTGGSNLATDRDHTHSFSASATASSAGAHTHTTGVTLNLTGGTHEHILPFGDHGGGLGWNRNYPSTSAAAFNDLRLYAYDDPGGVTGTAYVATGGGHSHTGNSGSFVSDSQGGHTHPVPVTGTTGAASSAADPRPAWTGLLYLMRVQ